jgi:hypothetical protein
VCPLAGTVLAMLLPSLLGLSASPSYVAAPNFFFLEVLAQVVCCVGVPIVARRPYDFSFYGDLLNCISPILRGTYPLAKGMVPFDPGEADRGPLLAMEEEDACSLSLQAVHLVRPSMSI